MAEKTIVAPEIRMEARKVACVQGVEREKSEIAAPYQQRYKPLLEQYNGIIKEIESSIDSRIMELENERSQIIEEANAESARYNAKRKAVWEEVELLDREVTQAEAEDRKLQGRLLATPKKKKESAERLEGLKEKAREARENAEKYYKEDSEHGIYTVESHKREKEITHLLFLRTSAGELKETLLNELKQLKFGGSAKYLDQVFPDLMKKLVALGTEINSVDKEWTKAVDHRDVEFTQIRFQAASNPDEHMQEADLIELEYLAPLSWSVLSGSNKVHVTENGQIDWSLKENMGALRNHEVVAEGLLVSPESISTLPVESAVHVMRSGFEKKFANVLTKEAYRALSSETKKVYPTFESWRESCLKSFKSKAKEVELYSQAKESAWREYAGMARVLFPTNDEAIKRRVITYPYDILEKLTSGSESSAEVKKKWHSTVMAKKKALELVDAQAQEAESGTGQPGEE